jgi:hypothetical protein
MINPVYQAYFFSVFPEGRMENWIKLRNRKRVPFPNPDKPEFENAN